MSEAAKRKSDETTSQETKKIKLTPVPECSLCFEEKKSQAGFFCPNNDCGVWTCLKPCFETLMKGDFAMACATCHTEIDRPQWHRLFPTAFITECMNPKWAHTLYAKEQGKLSTYQSFASNEKEAREYDMLAAEKDAELAPLKEQLKELKERISNIETSRLTFKNSADRCRSGLQMQNYRDRHPPAVTTATTAKKEPTSATEPSFSTHCLTPDCNGFMDRNMFCSLCDKTYCGDCHEDKHPDTPCDADKQATILMVRQNTKPCPKCGTNISKVSGCYQMWCPYQGCNTFFDWGTGRELKNLQFRHNPEYTEALRNGGLRLNREPEGGCQEGTPNLHRLLNAHGRCLSIAASRNDPRVDAIIAFHRSHNHLRDPANNYEQNTEAKHRMSGIKFLLKCTDKNKAYDTKEYHSDLRRIAKEDYYRQEIRDILRTCVEAGRDIFRNYMADGNVDQFYQQCCFLAEITNKEIYATCERYGGLRPMGLFVMKKTRLNFLSYLSPNEADKDLRPAKQLRVPALVPALVPATPSYSPTTPSYSPTSPSYSASSP